ncbi:YlbD family protein [Bacillus carboniphilus]|uniref:YlbD family protein n=1 Tax=Bacillus carboniphilus TaxID=86663 RepID=A0ABY9JYP9_9BACI|nr:YlbD family protein [Bacillus carboniphilus]WLR43648.1 YlbD family protein [Bacillus carboniphilus]
MAQKQVEQFKDFVRKHPKLIEEVRKGNKKWKNLFEDWYILGEDDEYWVEYASEDDKEDTKDAGLLTSVLTAFKNMDTKLLNEQLYKMNDTIENIQGLISQFQKESSSSKQPKSPFSFRKD